VERLCSLSFLVRTSPVWLIGISGIAITVCSLTLTARAQETTAPKPKLASLSIEAAVSLALKQHPALIRAQEQVEVARERKRQAASGQQPTIAIQAMASDGPLGAPVFGPLNNPALNGVPPIGLNGLTADPVKRQFGASLNVQHTLLDFGRTRHLVTSRQGLIAAAEADVETQKALIILNVEQAYYAVLRQQQLVQVQQENVRQRETTLQQAKVFVEGGLKSGVDLQVAQANAAETRVYLLAAENELKIALASLNYALGETKETIDELTPIEAVKEGAERRENASRPATPATLAEAIAIALKQRPEMRSIALQIRAADGAVHSVESEKQPRLDAVGSVGAINPSRVITNNKNYGVAVALTIPLYGAGAVEGRVGEERQKRDVLRAIERETAELIKLQVTRAYLHLQTREAQIRAAGEQAIAAQNSVRLAKERYQFQLNSVVELTDAEAVALRARVQEVTARYDREAARAELEWAMGAAYHRYSDRTSAGPTETTTEKAKKP
jgi:outer membrane protein